MRAYKEENPEKEVISLGIGDVTQPLVPAIIEALHGAVGVNGTCGNFLTVMHRIWAMNF